MAQTKALDKQKKRFDFQTKKRHKRHGQFIVLQMNNKIVANKCLEGRKLHGLKF